jgi:hypothetical protein
MWENLTPNERISAIDTEDMPVIELTWDSANVGIESYGT